MARRREKNTGKNEGFVGIGGFLGGLGSLLEKLGDLADTGEELRKSGEIKSPTGKVRGVYGFSIKVGLGDEGIKVEPFGNVRRDSQTGRAVVHEICEPLVDIFDEQDHVLVLAEMPGVGEGDIHLGLKDDILTLAAEKGDKKYRKEVLLPASFSSDKMSYRCQNGVLEIKLTK
jgi:HSP20 family protein